MKNKNTNKMKKVTITPMNGKEPKVMSFPTEREAINYFVGKCDEMGYEYNSNCTLAGGIGHDYRIERN